MTEIRKNQPVRFEAAADILHTLLVESNARQSPTLHPLLRFSHIFKELLASLPMVDGEFPGIFGLEQLTADEHAEWERRIVATRPLNVRFVDPTPESAACRKIGFAVEADWGRGHTTIDFSEVLQNGLKYYYEQVQGNSIFEQAAAESLLAVKDFASGYNSCVPWEPATNFDEALNSIWLTYECIVLSEHVPWSYSWGRMDQYLLPFVQDLSKEELIEKFIRFFRFLNQFTVIDAAAALNIGGMEGFNDVSRAILEAAAVVRRPAPLLAVRVSSRLSEDDFLLTMRKELLLCGQPTFYGEESCRKALRTRGLPSELIDAWAVNSCMGLTIPSRDWQNMWGTVIMMPYCLELALNQGRLFKGAFPVETGVLANSVESFDTFDKLYEQVLAYLSFFFRFAVEQVRLNNARARQCFQNAFLSVFYHDSISRKREVRDGGVQFTTMIVETIGFANLADSLLVIKKLVFETKKYTLTDIIEALRTDFAENQELLSDIRGIPKYGENDAENNALISQLADDIAAIAQTWSDGHFFCAPSLHTLDAHISYGSFCGATADGRHAGAPLAKNAGTCPDISVSHTSLLLSATAWNQTSFSGGQALDLWISPDEWSTPEGRQKYMALMRVYFERGGLQLHVNGADVNMLREAMEHPENYPDLFVRIGGFSRRFTALSRREQLDFITRFSVGM